jgi:MFS family permease
MSDQEEPTGGHSVFQEPSYVRFWLARICSTVSFQMAAVAVGWQVYELTRSTFALGMVGLVQFLPMFLLMLVVGHVADRFNRKTIISICQALESSTLAMLAIGSYLHRLHPVGIYCAVAAIGAARAFENPSTQALVPGLVRVSRAPQAIAWATSATQSASIVGPALGGLLYVFGAHVPYGSCACLYGIAAILSLTIVPKRRPTGKGSMSANSIFPAFITSASERLSLAPSRWMNRRIELDALSLPPSAATAFV